jgi:hypothetical protein
MEIGIGSSFSLLSIILFLLPGLAGIKLGLRIAERGDWLNRLETTGLSFGLSLAAMFAIYFIASIVKSLIEWNIGFISQSDVINYGSTLPSLIFFYLLLVVLALTGGFFLGKFDFGGKYFSPTLPWARFHQLAEGSGKGETYAVRVRTTSGEELRGKVEDEGEAALNKDIILENPLRLRFSEDGSVVNQKSWTGNAYIHSQSIAHVEFDRLEDADASEAVEYERQGQRTLEEASIADDEEMEELEKLAEEGEEANEQEEE